MQELQQYRAHTQTVVWPTSDHGSAAMQAGARDVADAVDLGCATGLSTAHVRSAFPGAQVTGVDLSPHMVAVGRHLQQQRQVNVAPQCHASCTRRWHPASARPSLADTMQTDCNLWVDLRQCSHFQHAFWTAGRAQRRKADGVCARQCGGDRAAGRVGRPGDAVPRGARAAGGCHGGHLPGGTPPAAAGRLTGSHGGEAHRRGPVSYIACASAEHDMSGTCAK